MRRFSVGLAVVVACGCATPPTQDDEATEPATAGADPYAAYDLPQVTDDWGALEYAKVRDALIEIDRNQPELLLTLAGPKGDVLARVASLPKLDEVIADMSDTKAMFEINDSIVAIYKIYAGRVAQQQPYG